MLTDVKKGTAGVIRPSSHQHIEEITAGQSEPHAVHLSSDRGHPQTPSHTFLNTVYSFGDLCAHFLPAATLWHYYLTDV